MNLILIEQFNDFDREQHDQKTPCTTMYCSNIDVEYYVSDTSTTLIAFFMNESEMVDCVEIYACHDPCK